MPLEVDVAEFHTKLDEVMEVAPGTVSGGQRLEELENWDSVAVLSFIAMADRDYGVRLSPKALAAARTVDDLLRLVREAGA